MDAFAAAVAKGSAHSQKHTLISALKVGVVFGVVEAFTPLVGYMLGVIAESWVSQFDHWLSFVLLSGLGVHLIYEALWDKEKDDTKKDNATKDDKKSNLENYQDNNSISLANFSTDDNQTNNQANNQADKGLKLTILTAFATSIDAMVIGISLAFLKVDIYVACLMIGLATTMMATLGVYLGAYLGEKIGKIAEVLGGLVLIGIGSFILWSHLMK